MNHTYLPKSGVLLSALSGIMIASSNAALIDFSGVDLGPVSSPSGQTFTYTVGAGPDTGILTVWLISGSVSSLRPGYSPDSTGFYALSGSTDPIVFRFTFDTLRTFTITENETLTALENNAFTLPSGAWTILSASGAAVGGAGSNINFQGVTDSPSPEAYSIEGIGTSFDFAITNTPGFPIYGSSISVDVVPAGLGTYSISIVPTDSSHATILWPTNAFGWDLESTVSLASPNWNTITNASATAGTNFALTVNLNETSRFFRLHKQ